MTSLIQHAVNSYKEKIQDVIDSIDTWPKLESTAIVLCIVSTYLTFVLKIGPKIMEKRPAYKLTNILIIYNAFQVLFSCWMIYKIFEIDIYYVFVGQRCNVQNYMSPSSQHRNMKAIKNSTWWYFVAKISEYLDTIFFTLRKKRNQISFLHLYHHTVASLISWCYLKLLPGEQGAVLGFLNTGVHVIMYSYYFIAALGPEYEKYIWWKKYVTRLQLAQFVLMLIYLAFILATECPSTRLMTCFFTVNISFLLYLFSAFYIRTYIKKKTA